MGCTAGCLNIYLNEDRYKDLFAKTFIDVKNEHFYEPFDDKNDVLELFNADGDVIFTLGAAAVQHLGI